MADQGWNWQKQRLDLLPELEVIILSGYDDFSYAQQAIRNGVTDYLLKTSKPEEIIKTVPQAKSRITERWAPKSQEGKQLRENRERLFASWVIEGNTESGVCPAFLEFDTDQADIFSSMREERRRERSISRQVVLIQASGWNRASDASAAICCAKYARRCPA